MTHRTSLPCCVPLQLASCWRFGSTWLQTLEAMLVSLSEERLVIALLVIISANSARRVPISAATRVICGSSSSG